MNEVQIIGASLAIGALAVAYDRSYSTNVLAGEVISVEEE